MHAARFLCITVMSEYIQNEGIEGVLDNLIIKAGANAVATSPYLMEPANERTGSREPPIDPGAGLRRLPSKVIGKKTSARRNGTWRN